MEQRQKRLLGLERHILRLERHLQTLYSLDDTFTRWRTGLFLGGVLAVLIGMAFDNRLALVIVPIWMAIFGGLVYQHRRVRQTLEQFRLWRWIKSTHHARMRLDWDSLPPESVETPREHPFAVDLDITGRYSLHRLLDTPASQNGSERLKTWLLAETPDRATIQQRQALIQELLPLSTFRDRLTLNALLTAGKHTQKWNGAALLEWLRDTTEMFLIPARLLVLLLGLAGLNALLFFLHSIGLLPPLWIGGLVVYLALSAFYWRKLGGLFGEALRIEAQMRRLRAVFLQLETYDYGRHTKLRALCAPFLETGQRPSAQLRRISLIAAAASLQGNFLLWLPLNMLLPWDIACAYLLNRSKGNLAVVLPRWLDVWYELETLSALTNFAYLNPQYSVPNVEPLTESPAADAVFKGVQLGHPLIEAEDKVLNDFTMEQLGQIVIITGSNMAGKSSFLRTLGVNLILAYAGTVVNADLLHVGLFHIFTCIRVSDSVVDGFSYFYAEVRRLKALLVALNTLDALPLFYLIDEIFRGTNNRERLIGSRSYIRSLVAKNGIGLIATHDLELTRLADEMSNVQNYHFREEVSDNRMVFDYRLRSGPSPTTNALKIMRLEGLPVEGDEV